MYVCMYVCMCTRMYFYNKTYTYIVVTYLLQNTTTTTNTMFFYRIPYLSLSGAHHPQPGGPPEREHPHGLATKATVDRGTGRDDILYQRPGRRFTRRQWQQQWFNSHFAVHTIHTYIHTLYTYIYCTYNIG
jgi:hypothetical protein